MKSKYPIKKPFYKQAFPMAIFILLIVYVVTFLTPFVWAMLTSVNSHALFIENSSIFIEETFWVKIAKVLYIPRVVETPLGSENGFTFENYAWAIENFKIEMQNGAFCEFGDLLANSFIYSIVATVITTTTHAVTAYISARYSHHKIAAILYPIVIVTMVLPIVGALPSELDMMQRLGFYDRVWGLWLMKGGFLGSNFLIFYATFKGISWEYAEAAFVDGASHFRVLAQIMIPLAAGSIGALMLITFITYWNDWKVNIQYIPTTWPMISYALFRFQSDGGIPDINSARRMAGCIIIAVPLIIIFIIFRKKLMGSLTIGGIKG
jgi:raffinose/stachyose/melibiose transport system permease protein/N-acetylglucosamine transport system permease protein